MLKPNINQRFMTIVFIIVYLIGLFIIAEGNGNTITTTLSWIFLYILLYIAFAKTENL